MSIAQHFQPKGITEHALVVGVDIRVALSRGRSVAKSDRDGISTNFGGA